MPTERMDIRRLHSVPLVDGDLNPQHVVSQSPSGSPSAHSGRLPALWKTFKAKLGSLTTSRSSSSLSTMATEVPSRPASPSASPPVDSSVHSASNYSVTSRRMFAKVSHSQLSPAPAELSASRSVPVAVSMATPPATAVNADGVPTQDMDGFAGNASSAAIAQVPSTLPSTSSMPATPSPSGTAQQPQSYGAHSNGTSIDQSTSSTSGTSGSSSVLLAVSPALPPAMKRPVWVLEDYAIAKRLYKGSSSAVYKATCRRSGVAVALKVYFLSRVPINVVHMLKREIEIHTQLVHKHVARLYGAFMDGNERVVLVEEFAAQGDLFGIMQRLGGRMLAEQAAGAVLQPFLDALAYLHSKGVCHRDIKPENILFTGSWRLLLADFGVSINLNQERAVTRAGTEGYMAPEVERCPLKTEPGENKDNPQIAYSTAVDIWAVGVLAYELLVGFPPVVMPKAAKPGAAADFVQSQMTAAALHFPASVPPLARSFVIAALAADPAERPTAAQLLQHPWLQQQAAAGTAAAAAAAPGRQAAEPAGPEAEVSASVMFSRKAAAAGQWQQQADTSAALEQGLACGS